MTGFGKISIVTIFFKNGEKMENFKYLISLIIILLSPSIIFSAEKLSQEEQKHWKDMLFQGVASPENIDLVKSALAAGINPNIQDASGWTPLEHASYNGFKNSVIILLNAKADPNIQDNMRRTPLLLAIINDEVDIVRLLLRAGANPNIIYNQGTALDYAIENKNYEIIKLLQELRRQAIKKEIIESTTLIPELADIASEYAECPKPERRIVEE